MEAIEEIKQANSLDLLEYISWKEEDLEVAKTAFDEFCIRYDQAVLKKAEIYCMKWNLSSTVALDITKCTLSRVWKHTTYDHNKSKTTNIDNGIKRWLSTIIFTQLANYTNKGTCFEPDKETDLSLIYNLDDYVENSTLDTLSKKALRQQLGGIEDVLNNLSKKQRVIYLTYMLYAPDENKNIPRGVSKKLQDELDLRPGSIRKYKFDAIKIVQNFLNPSNGR